MQCQTPDQLAGKKCVPCEGGVPKYSRAQAEEQLTCLSGWQLTHDGLRIRKDWTVKNFLAGLEFINSVAKVAEAEDHHPDLHLESYRKLWIEIWTHAIGGLSENDFILAAKIDRLPIQLKKSDQKFARSLVEKRPMAQVLVTGASGFIGKQLVAALVARGDDVTCLVRPTSVVESLQNLGARLAIGDVTEPASLPAALASVDAVYHLAGVTKANTYADYCTINEAGVHNVVEACARRTTPPVLLLVSSLAAAGPTLDTNHLRTEVEPPRPRSRYGRSKRAGEQAAEARAGEVPITIVRPPIVLGPGDETSCAMFRAIRRFRSFLVLGSHRRVSVVHVADLASALIAACERGQRLPAPSSQSDRSASGAPHGPGCGYYFIAGDEHPEFAELGRMIGRAVGRPRAWRIPLPLATIWIMGVFGEIVGRLTGRPRYLNFDRARDLWAGHWTCSPEKAHRELGFAPAVPLAERINQTAVWYRDHGWLNSIERSWFVRDESAN